MLVDYLAGDDLLLYTADEQGAIAAAVERAEDALERQSAFMDSLIGARYQLPLPLDAVAASPLRECCLALSRAYLADDADNMSQTIENARQRWIKWLNDLARDNAIIPNAPRVSVGASEDGYHTAAIPARTDLSSY
jgi:phage gp36-like protein